MSSIDILVIFQSILTLFIFWLLPQLERPFKVLIGALLVGYVFSIVSNFVFVYTTNLVFNNLLGIFYDVSYIILNLLFFKWRYKERYFSRLLIAACILLPLIILVRDIYFGLLFNSVINNNLNMQVGIILIIAGCLRVLYLFIKKADQVDLYKKPEFWMIVSMLLYNSLYFVHFGFLNLRFRLNSNFGIDYYNLYQATIVIIYELTILLIVGKIGLKKELAKR